MSIFDRMLARRWLTVAGILAFTALWGFFAARVKPDYSIEMLFPTFHKSRVEYEHFKKDFPFEDAHAIVIVEAPDLFTPAGIARLQKLEDDLGRIPGVVDTEGLATIKDLTSDGDTLRMEKLFPRADLSPTELDKRRKTATSDPLFVWNLAPPDGHATTIRVTLSRETASKEATRTEFLHAARTVLAKHERPGQKLTLNGLPVIRSEFTELINNDVGRMTPIALLVILVLLGVTFRSVGDVVSSLITILFSIVWTRGVMGLLHVPIQILTNVTPTIVMIVSISDTVHIIAHFKDEMEHGKDARTALVTAMRESAMPCLLTEITIAGGFISLLANDMVMIQQFGIVTAAGMLLTWVANVTVLPVMLSLFKPRLRTAREASRAETGFRRFVAAIERTILHRPRTIVVVAAAITVVSGIAASFAGKEYYSYDDLRPNSRLAKNLRYVEQIHGGTVPLAIFVEPKERKADAMLEPAALALLDRIGHKLESAYPDDIKNAGSLAKVMRKAHRLLAGEDIARESPLPRSRALAAQELLAIDDPRTMRDYLSFDRATASVFTEVPDRGSSHATVVIRELRDYFAKEEAATGYKITLTGIYGIADGIYNSLVGGLAGSLAGAVAISFAIFCVVLRSWRLALIALVPNVLPLLLTLGIMSVLRIDIKPSTVIIFSITLVISDDDTIQYLARFRWRFHQLVKAGEPDPHSAAALGTLRETGMPMFVTAVAVSLGFLTMLFSEFLAVANLGLLIGVSLISAVFADLFLSPLLIIHLRPRLAPTKESKQQQAA